MKTELLFGEFPVLKSERICLDKITTTDIDELFEIYDNNNVFKYCGIIPKHNKETVSKMVAHFERDFNKQKVLKWGIFNTETKKLLGIIEIGNYNKKLNLVTIGYFLSEKAWNAGIATESVSMLVRYLFEEIEVNRIQAEVMPKNEYSRIVLLKNNFVSEGILREANFWAGKGIVDLEIFSILKSEFIKR